jgi:hypothetical protein
MSENTKLVIFLFVSFSAFFLLTHLRKFVRSFRLKKLAFKYDLSYSKNYWLFYIDYSKLNQIKGNINGHEIEVFDFTVFQTYVGVGRGISKYGTFLIVDGSTIVEINNSFLGIGKIEEELKKIA